MRSVESAILHLLETENIDVSRMYVCGLSMENGTWDLIGVDPNGLRPPARSGSQPHTCPQIRRSCHLNWHGMQTRPAVELFDQIFPPFATGEGHLKNPFARGWAQLLESGPRRRPTRGLAVYPPI